MINKIFKWLAATTAVLTLIWFLKRKIAARTMVNGISQEAVELLRHPQTHERLRYETSEAENGRIKSG